MTPKSLWPTETRAARSEAGRILLGASLTLALLAAGPAYGAGAKEKQFSSFMMNQNEIRFGAHKGYTWEAVAWIGTHTEKMYLKSEGESESGEGLETGEVQVRYSWQISDFFDAQAASATISTLSRLAPMRCSACMAWLRITSKSTRRYSSAKGWISRPGWRWNTIF